MECCYGDACEHLSTALVPYKYYKGELHHIYQVKFERDYGIDSNLVYMCRPCVEYKYKDVIEAANGAPKEAADDRNDFDGTICLSTHHRGIMITSHVKEQKLQMRRILTRWR